jgi:hypothetical protein
MIDAHILDAVCRQLHIVAQKRKGRRPAWLGLPYEALDKDIRDKYQTMAEPVLNALLRAGFIPLPEAEVKDAWQPRKRVTVVRKVLRVTEEGAKIG